MRGRLLFEKTPAYFDQMDPAWISCVVPSARLLLMLRMPVARAVSAYRMCQGEMHAEWCAGPLEAALARVLVAVRGNDSSERNTSTLQHVRANRAALRREPHVRRLLVMGQYALHLRRWLRAVPPAQLGVLWVEQFKAEAAERKAAAEAKAKAS